jgi:hypothetical protein
MLKDPMKSSRMGTRNRLCLRLLLFAGIAVVTSIAASSEAWEPLETRGTADLQPAEILSGENFKIGDRVETDGFLNFYDLQTDYGVFSADSDWELEIRLAEVAGMAELGKISMSKAVTDSLVDTALAPVDAAADLVTDPIGTAKSMGRGVSNLFKRTKRVAKKVTEKKEKPAEGEEGAEDKKKLSKEEKKKLAEEAMGYDKQERLWAYKLLLDPYSDNEIFRTELKRVAKASALGGASFKLRTFDKIEGGMPGVHKDLYILEEKDLRVRNEKILTDAGFMADSFESFEAFFENSSLSPTLQTIILDCFVRLEGVAGREQLIELAASMETGDEARFQVGYLEFLSAFHEKTELKRIEAGPAFPAAWTQDGRAILMMAADHLSWTEDLALGLQAHLEQFDLTSQDGAVVLYLAGDATAPAKEGLAAMGVQVKTSEF